MAFVSFGVLSSLGCNMIVCGVLQRLKPSLLFVLSLLAIAISQWLIPPATDVNTFYSPVVRVLLIPGQTGVLKVLFPILSWLGISLWGVIFGKLLLTKKQTAMRGVLGFSLCLLAFFGTVHLLFEAGDFHAPVSQTWMGYLTLTKYPPSMAFIALTMGVNLLLLFGISQMKNQNNMATRLLSGFGRVPFFFYILPHRSLKLRADFKNRQAIGDREHKRSPKGAKSAAEEEKGA